MQTTEQAKGAAGKLKSTVGLHPIAKGQISTYPTSLIREEPGYQARHRYQQHTIAVLVAAINNSISVGLLARLEACEPAVAPKQTERKIICYTPLQ